MRDEADQAATEAMRRTMDETDIAGTMVIGEGERDEAPMLYIGEQVGRRDGNPAGQVDIAVDPLEGTNLVATGQGGAITVLAASETGGLTNAPDTYLEKLAVGPVAAGCVDITRPAAENTNRIAEALRRKPSDITVIILDRPRHTDLIAEVRSTGARIKLISDGDVSAAIACAVQGTGVHAVMGIGGAPEGVITAAALRCLGGEIQARFRFRNDEERERAKAMLGHADEDRVYRTEDLAGGEQLVFAATGVTEGESCRASGSSAAARGRTRWSWPTRRSRSGSSTPCTCSTATGRRRSGSRRSRSGGGPQPSVRRPSGRSAGQPPVRPRPGAGPGPWRPTRPSRAARGPVPGRRAGRERTTGCVTRHAGR